MIDLLKLEAPEAERIAYAKGFTMAAELFTEALQVAKAELANLRTITNTEE